MFTGLVAALCILDSVLLACLMHNTLLPPMPTLLIMPFAHPEFVGWVCHS